MFIRLHIPASQQPQFGGRIKSRGIWRGLRAAIVPGIPYDLVSEEPIAFGSSAETRGVGLYGNQDSFGTNMLKRIQLPTNPNGNGFSLIVLGNSTNLTSNLTACELSDASGNPTGGIHWRGDLSAKRPEAFVSNASYTTTAISSTSYLFTSGQWLMLAAVANPSNVIQLGYQGKFVGSNSRAVRSEIDYLTVGNRYDGTQGMIGGEALCLYFDRDISAAELWEIYRRPWEFLEPSNKFALFPAGGGGAVLTADASVTASATAALTTAIPLAGASIAISSASGSIITAIPLQAAAAAVANAGGILSASIKLNAAAIAAATAAAGMSSAIQLLAAAAAQASATANLTIQIRLAGDAVALAAASADLTTPGNGLSGNAAANASASAALTTAIPLHGAALSIASAGGDLITLIPLQAAAASIVSVSGSLDTAITLSAAAAAQALAGGDLTATIRFNAAAVANAAASGILSGGTYIPPLSSRLITMQAESRRLAVKNETRRITA